MVVVCTSCQARFRVADEKVGPRGARVRCTKCRTVFAVGPPGPGAEAGGAPAPAPDPGVGRATPAAVQGTRPVPAEPGRVRAAVPAEAPALSALPIPAPPRAVPEPTPGPVPRGDDPFSMPAADDLRPPPAPELPDASDPFAAFAAAVGKAAAVPEPTPFPDADLPDPTPVRARGRGNGAPASTLDEFLGSLPVTSLSDLEGPSPTTGGLALEERTPVGIPLDGGSVPVPDPEPWREPGEPAGAVPSELEATPGPMPLGIATGEPDGRAAGTALAAGAASGAADADPGFTVEPGFGVNPGLAPDPGFGSDLGFGPAGPGEGAPPPDAFGEPADPFGSAAPGGESFEAPPPAATRDGARVQLDEVAQLRAALDEDPGGGPEEDPAAARPPAAAPGRPGPGARGTAERPPAAAPGARGEEPGPVEGDVLGTGRLHGVLVNAVSLAALLVLTAAILLWWRGGTALGLLGLRGAAEGLSVDRTRNGFYDTASGRPLVFVRGQVTPRGAAPPGPVRVRADLMRAGKVLATAEGTAGAVPTPEELAAVATPADEDRLRAELAARAPAAPPAGQALPFVVTFLDAPADLGGVTFRVTAEPARRP